jgi:hypothetical protein
VLEVRSSTQTPISRAIAYSMRTIPAHTIGYLARI